MAMAREGGVWKYGGTRDKRPCKTELERTYVYEHLLEIEASRGSGMPGGAGTLVHAENLALARLFGGLSRAAERLSANAVPVTAHEALASWVERLGVTVNPEDSWDDVRIACAAQYKLSLGPTEANEDAAIADLLGPALVNVHRITGVDLDNPPPQTFWPVANPGPASYDMGGGTWLSERAHLVVEVQQPTNMTLTAFLRLMNVRLFKLLDGMLPSFATFDWVLTPLADGFLLDISDMDFDGFN